MLGGGSAALRIETGRWNGLKREERICRHCTMRNRGGGTFLLRCEDLKQERSQWLIVWSWRVNFRQQLMRRR